ncbi:helix-turn-helix transcriptional regulator [Nocardia puris]|uniref:HxlR family transcriptional regulator n=1 Tax=Nocardia puris TaxID=208602 RepID=A0A366E395_9NOCA|nr:helix-turn-helix domain-containing protein [Nocardia puris]MBF6212598.1 helix-turn-helix transcriptional regulator [Nocardia puris]MBF6369178.1 helix-turn-helix transcriptional regulator [Nocardia puris]MBF6461187.1 helix-turn-helix transcriptional regulator [Nocardia puris]RBO96585.1 HxlR family transcriptional regulator [Nocardia puris]
MCGKRSPSELRAGGDNAIAVTLGLLGDEWNLWILRHALRGDRRYLDWMSRGGISNAVLTHRLSQLTDVGLFTRSAYQDNPRRYEYLLTPRGRGVWPILLGLWNWELRWSSAAVDLPRIVHADCGAPCVPELRCGICAEVLDLDSVVADPGPSGEWGRSVPAASGRRRSSSASAAAILPDTMRLIGNRWSVAVLGALMLGTHRFRDFSARVGASPAIIAGRLQDFVAAGVAEAAPNPDRPGWVWYRLTDKGRDFFPVIYLMITWGQRWFRAPEGDALVFRHRDHEHAPEPRWVCDQCHQPISGGSIIERPGRRSGVRGRSPA